MEKISNIVYGLVALVVIILITTTVALPVIDSTQNNITTIENNTAFSLKAIDAEKITTTIEADGSVVKVGGYETQFALKDVLYASNFEVYIPTSGTIRFYDVDNNIFANSNISSMLFSIVNGVVTYTYNETDYTTTLEGPAFILDSNGDYGAFAASESFNVSLDEKVYFTRPAQAPNNLYLTRVSGTMDNLKIDSILYWDSVESEYKEFEEESVLTVSGYDLSDDGHSYIVSSDTIVTITTSINGNETTWDLHGAASTTYAPIGYEVTDPSNTLSILLGIIPLLLMIIPVMIVARLVTNGRD